MKPYTPLIPYIAAALILFCAYLIFDNSQKAETIKGMRESDKIKDALFEDQKIKNQRKIDSLNDASEKKIIEAKSKAIDSTIKVWRNKPKGTYNEEIDAIDNSDTTRISREFTKLYPHNNGTGKGSY